MKRTLLAFALLLALPLVGSAQQGPENKTIALFLGYDLDGAAAANNTIVASATLVDSTSYTVIAPTVDVSCRALLLTIVDANTSISAGTVTTVGTDADGNYKTTVTSIGGGGSATYALGTYCSVVSVSNGVLTGEDGATDTIQVGTTGSPLTQYPIAWGPVVQPFFALSGVTTTPASFGLNNRQAYQPGAAFQWEQRANTGALAVKTVTANTTTLASFTSGSGALAGLAVGDLLLINDDADIPVVVGVTAIASANSVTIDREITILRTGGRAFAVRRLKSRSGLYSGWFRYASAGYKFATVQVGVEQLSGTGGITVSVECAAIFALATQQVGTTSLTAVSTYTLAIPEPWDVCRVGLKWGTNDDATDTGTAREIINGYVTLRN